MDPVSMQQLVQQVQDQQQTIASLQKELSSLKTTLIDGLLAKKDGSTKAKLPDVDKFDGSIPMWEVWFPEIQAKLRIDNKSLGETDEAKFWYIYGRLDKKVQALVAPQLKAAERNLSYNPEDLFLQLARLCDNPNAKREAQDKLYSLKQFVDQSFNVYLAVFERQLYKAEADIWDDDAKISLIRRQLNDKFKKRLRYIYTQSHGYKTPQSTVELMQIGTIHTVETNTDDDKPKLLFNPKTGKYIKV